MPDLYSDPRPCEDGAVPADRYTADDYLEIAVDIEDSGLDIVTIGAIAAMLRRAAEVERELAAFKWMVKVINLAPKTPWVVSDPFEYHWFKLD